MNKEEKEAIKLCGLLLNGEISLHIIDDDGGTAYAGSVHKDYNKALETVLNLVKTQERQLKIKDNYLELLIDIGIDYDGLEKPESLKGLIDELIGYAVRAKRNDDKYVAYWGGPGRLGKSYNILHEELLESDENNEKTSNEKMDS